MRFQISGIKQIKGKQENLSFLIDGQDESAVREFASKNSIAIFELKPYTGQKEAFGKVLAKVNFLENSYELVFPMDKAKDVYGLLAGAGLKVTYVNTFDHRMSDEDVAMVIQKFAGEFTEESKKVEPKERNASIKNVVLQKDPELEKMKRIGAQAVSDIEEIKMKGGGTGMMLRKMNELKELEDELKKTRMGSNIPKMRSLISDAYKLMEQIEMDYLDQQKAAEANLIEDSIVTHLDLVREYEKYEKAQKVKKGNLEKTPSDMYYIFFGKTGMYQRFLGKDLEKKFTNRGEMIYNSIDYLIIFILMVFVWLTIASLYQHYVLEQEVFFFAFVDFALIGLILIVINKLKNHHLSRILFLFIMGAIAYFTIRYLLISNFAL